MKLLNFAIQTAQKAGKLILKESKKALIVSEKGKNDLVTNVDKASEALIINEIKSVYPTHSILAEESSFLHKTQVSNFKKSKYIWIIDPLDGTTNFAHRLPLYSISIAIFETKVADSSKNFDYLEGELIAGVVFAPALNEIYYAEKNKGAFLNGKKIKVSNIGKIENSLLVTGFPTTHREINLPYFEAMLSKAQAMRRLGSAALDLCYIASGRFDAYWEFGLKPWDIAAGALIVEEAGGKITDTNGNLLDLFGKDILATNGKVHKEVVTTFKPLA